MSEGNRCEFRTNCRLRPIVRNGYLRNCSRDKCTIMCDTGYVFLDGSTGMELTCENRSWSPEKPTQNFDLNCLRKI